MQDNLPKNQLFAFAYFVKSLQSWETTDSFAITGCNIVFVNLQISTPQNVQSRGMEIGSWLLQLTILRAVTGNGWSWWNSGAVWSKFNSLTHVSEYSMAGLHPLISPPRLPRVSSFFWSYYPDTGLRLFYVIWEHSIKHGIDKID